MKKVLEIPKSFILIIGFYLSMQLTTWLPLRFWGWWGGGNFLDTWQILQNAHCYESIGLRVYQLSNGCSWLYPYGRPLLQFLSTFHLFESHARYVGFLFLLLLAIVLSSLQKIVAMEPKRIAIFFIFTLLSPPMLLLAERGNFDILMLALVYLAGDLFFKKRYFLSSTLIFISALIKFYSFPLLLIFLLIPKTIKLKIFTSILVVISFLSIWRDIQTTEYTYQGGPKVVFGSELVFSHIGQFESMDFLFENRKILGIILSMIQIAIIYILIKRGSVTLQMQKNSDRVLIIYFFLAVISICCYFAGINTDYRMVFILFATLLLIFLLAKKNETQGIVINLALISAWLSFPSGGLEILGDISLGLLTCIHLVFVFMNRLEILHVFFRVPKTKLL